MQPSTALSPPEDFDSLPDHTQLPDSDGEIVENFQEAPQAALLTACFRPRLRELHPDGQFIIGMDSGIYWRYTDPPLAGCKSPDWYYVPGVPPMLKGKVRRSYVLWKEHVPPAIAIEFVSKDGSEERDDTPFTGKFWVYEQGIRIPYYAIFDGFRDTLEVHRLRNGRYEPVPANAAGRFPIEPLGVELGLWYALYDGIQGSWVRPWDIATGEMLPSSEERIETAESVAEEFGRELSVECERAENERKRADTATKQAATEAKRAKTEARRANRASKQAETEAKRADALKAQLEKLQAQMRALGIEPHPPA